MCAKDDLVGRKGLLLTSTQTWEVLFQTYDGRLAGELATAESVTAKDSNYVDTFGLDFAFSFAAWLQRIKCTLGDVDSLFADNILSLIAFIISYCLFADELVYALNGAIVVLIIILVDKTQLLLILGDVAAWLVYVIIGNLSLLENAAKSGILLACADGRIRQCYLTICAILRCLDKGHDDFVHLVDCFGWKHYNFNIYVSLATDTLHLLLKDMLDDIYPGSRKTWDNSTTLVTQESGSTQLNERFYIRMYGALDGICTGANSEAYYITMVKQFYSMTNKKEYILQIYCTYSTRVIRLLLFCRLGWLILGIQPYSIKLPLSEVAVNIAISDFIHAAAVFIYSSIKCWRSSGKRHNDPEHCDEEVVRCVPNWQQIGLWRRDYVWVQEFEHGDNRRQSRTVTDDGKYMAYIGAFSEVLLFNNNGQIDNTTGMLTFKFYDLSTIICLVHLVLRDLPDLITRTTMSYYVNNYIDWDEYNCLYSLTFDIDLLRTL
ncbi:hypothetical protein HBH82_251200 [Parastagonospora nodorum]|nr:hypothetical protein HBH82_251200 [Parastagonospora nodorum]KAH4749507.1 hypothetical protein HBH63_248280 [Parastagonospora nodorum]KAH4767168.1 hypothetical protein HBH62_251410 [Parastagonospora nodorum]